MLQHFRPEASAISTHRHGMELKNFFHIKHEFISFIILSSFLQTLFYVFLDYSENLNPAKVSGVGI